MRTIFDQDDKTNSQNDREMCSGHEDVSIIELRIFITSVYNFINGAYNMHNKDLTALQLRIPNLQLLCHLISSVVSPLYTCTVYCAY
jgi:hypothetical protein